MFEFELLLFNFSVFASCHSYIIRVVYHKNTYVSDNYYVFLSFDNFQFF